MTIRQLLNDYGSATNDDREEFMESRGRDYIEVQLKYANCRIARLEKLVLDFMDVMADAPQ